MEIKDGLRYTKEHEWVDVQGNKAKMGITDYAQSKLGDITFIDPDCTGKDVKPGDAVTGIESVKAASDIYAPVTGKVVSFNEALENEPELVNKDPFGAGWVAELEITAPAEAEALMDAGAYKEYLSGLE